MHATRRAWKRWFFWPGRAAVCGIAAITFIGSMSGTAMALGCSSQISTLDCQAVTNNWVNWVPDPACQTTSDTTTLTGSDNEEKAFNYFRAKGLSAIAASAVVGNLMRESHLDPTIAQTGGDTKDPSAFTQKLEGWGIAQWDPGAKIIGIAKNLGVSGPIYELSTQLDIVWKEMTGTAPTGAVNVAAGLEKKSSLPAIDLSNPMPDDKNLGDATTATGYFQNLFEGGNDYGARVNLANAAFTKYGKNGVSGTTTTLSDASTDGGGTCTTTLSDVNGGACITTAGAGPFKDTNNAIKPPKTLPISLSLMCARAKALANQSATAATTNDKNHTAIFADWCHRTERGTGVVNGDNKCSTSGQCDFTASFMWGYANSGYDFATHNDDTAKSLLPPPPGYQCGCAYHWNSILANYSSHAHPGDLHPPVGALLFYNNDVYGVGGHIAVYLGNNWVVTSDMAPTANGAGITSFGRVAIVHAQAITDGPWTEKYLGWADPIIAGNPLTSGVLLNSGTTNL